jgi:hypothetical protein
MTEISVNSSLSTCETLSPEPAAVAPVASAGAAQKDGDVVIGIRCRIATSARSEQHRALKALPVVAAGRAEAGDYRIGDACIAMFAARAKSSRCRFDHSVLRFLQESDDMLARYRRESLEKIIDWLARLEVVEQSSHGNSRPMENKAPPITSGLREIASWRQITPRPDR